MGLYSIDNFKEEYNEIIEDIDNLEEISLFSNLLDSQLSFEEEYNAQLQESYSSISEAKKYDIIRTKFTQAMNIVIENYIKQQNIQIYRYINSFRKRIKEDKENIYPYLNKLKKYDSNEFINLGNSRYKYTHIFEDAVPDEKSLEVFISARVEVDEALSKYKTVTNLERLETLKTEYEKLVDYIKSGECYSKARAELLGINGEVSAENFSEEIFKCFRAGGDLLSEQVTPKEVREAAERFSKYEELLKDITIGKDSIWEPYRWIKKNLFRADLEFTHDWFGESKEEFDKFYNLYINLKTTQLLRLSQLHTQVICSRFEAIAKSYIQDREILIKACSIVSSNSNDINDTNNLEEYALFLIEEQYNAIETYLAMTRAMGNDNLVINESEMIALDEAAFGNLKNYLINVCERLSDVFNKFLNKIQDLTKLDEKFLNDNLNKLTSDVMIKDEATLTNYYSFSDIMAKVGMVKFSSITADEIEARAANGQWQTPEDYATQTATKEIAGFNYEAGGAPFKEQLENFLRGNKQDISSNALNPRMRANLVGFCKNDFPEIRKNIEFNQNALKTFGQEMDKYLATSANNNNAQTTTTVQKTMTAQTGTAQQQEAFSYEDTMTTYFNEVEIKDNTPNTVPNNQAQANANMAKQDAQEQKDQNKAVANATKSFIKVNIQKCSALMNTVMGAYRQSMKILRWYLKEYNKQTQNQEAGNRNNPTNNNQNNRTISGAIG